MNFTNVRDPAWADAAHTMIDCFVTFEEIEGEEVPFTATLHDRYSHTAAIFTLAVDGTFGKVAAFAPPVVDEKAIIEKQIKDKLGELSIDKLLEIIATGDKSFATSLHAEVEALKGQLEAADVGVVK